MATVTQLGVLDLIVFGGVVLLPITLTFLLPKPKGLMEYMLMGRRLTLPMFTATLVATWYGGILGVTEIAFKYGIYNFITQGAFWYLTYLIFAFFFVDRIRKGSPTTLPELVERLFGPKAAKIAAVFNLFNVIPIAYALSCGLIFSSLFGIPIYLGVIIGTSVVCLYSFWSGFRSVVLTDIVQFVCMCSAVALVLLFAISRYGGWSFLTANLPATHFSITGGHSIATTMVWGFIALSTLVDPNFYQRCFAASSNRTAKLGIVLSTVVWCLFDICTTFGAMYAAAAMPELNPGQAYLTFGLEILPTGLKGFFLAGLVATIFSTIDSYVFVASNTLTYDLLPKAFRSKLDWSRYGIFVVGAIAIVLANYFDGSIKEVWKTLGSYSAGCLLIPMTVGLLRPGFLSERDFIWATGSGAVAITYWRWAELTGAWAEVDDLYAGLFATLVSLIVCKFYEKLIRK